MQLAADLPRSRPRSTGWTTPGSTTSTNQVVVSRRARQRQGQQYSVDYVRSTTPRTRCAAPAPSSRGRPAPARLHRRARRIAEVDRTASAELIAGKTTQYDKVRAIYDYFSADQRLPVQPDDRARQQRQRDRRLPAEASRASASSTRPRWPGWCGPPASRRGSRSASPRATTDRRHVHADQLQPARLDRGLLRPASAGCRSTRRRPALRRRSVDSAWAPDPNRIARPRPAAPSPAPGNPAARRSTAAARPVAAPDSPTNATAEAAVWDRPSRPRRRGRSGPSSASLVAVAC